MAFKPVTPLVPRNGFQMIRDDHQHIRELFSRYEKLKGRREKRQIALAALHELKLHTVLEEEVFYPAVLKHTRDHVNVHHSIRMHEEAGRIAAEMVRVQNDRDFDSSFRDFMAFVRRHFDEEERMLLPRAEWTGMDLDFLADALRARRAALVKKPAFRAVPSGRRERPLMAA